MTATAGKPIAWALDSQQSALTQVDELKEQAIAALEEIERVMQAALEQGRFDVLHQTIRTFAALNLQLVGEAVKQFQADHPGELVD